MTCQNVADESRTGPTALGYIGLLSCSGIISRFGRQVRPGERVDSGLTAFRLSEFATLDKIRLRYKTRLGRFITSPRRLAALRLHHHNLTSHTSFFGDRPHAAWAPKSVLKTIHYPYILRSYRLSDKNENPIRNILKLTLLRLKRLDIVARSPEVRRGGQGVFTLSLSLCNSCSFD